MMATPIEIAVKKLAWEVESRKSIELRVTTTLTKHGADQNKRTGFDRYEEHYIETAAGQRFGEFQGFSSGKVISHSQHFGDGSKFADVEFSARNPDRQMNILIKRQYATEGQNDRKQIPPPLLYLYVGRDPLHKALPKGKYLGTDKVLGRECDKYLFPQVRWFVVQDQVFYLDRETAIPLKFEIFPNQEAMQRNEPSTDWVADSLDKVQGHHIPLASKTIAYNPDRSPQFTWNQSVKLVAFDKEYPASTFWPSSKPGVTMYDEFTGKSNTVPGAEKVAAKARPEVATSTLSAQAVPPENWATNASKASLGLGGAVLFAGIFLWWRRS